MCHLCHWQFPLLLNLPFLSFHTGCQHIYLESDIIAFPIYYQLGLHSTQQAALMVIQTGVSRQQNSTFR
jgi:hypothetical protein